MCFNGINCNYDRRRVTTENLSDFPWSQAILMKHDVCYGMAVSLWPYLISIPKL